MKREETRHGRTQPEVGALAGRLLGALPFEGKPLRGAPWKASRPETLQNTCKAKFGTVRWVGVRQPSAVLEKVMARGREVR